jgi:hypothetical protein
MARRFLKASSQYMTCDLPAVTTIVTFAAKFRLNSVPSTDDLGAAGRHALINRGIDTSVEANYFSSVTPTQLRMGFTHANTTFDIFNATVSWNTTSTYSIVQQWDWTNNEMEMWLDGAALTVTASDGAATNNPQTSGQTSQGIATTWVTGSPGGFGDFTTLSECMLWTGAKLTLADAKAYHLGLGRVVRQDALVRYWPLAGTASPEPDLKGGTSGTLSGTPIAATHPTVEDDFSVATMPGPQEIKHASWRLLGGTATTYEGDAHAAFTAAGVTAGPFDGRLLAWINARTGESYTNVNQAKQAYATLKGAFNWESLGSLA